MSRQIPFTEDLWYQKEDNIYTIGLNEESALSLSRINHLELPEEEDWVDSEDTIGYLDTDSGVIDIYSPVEGQVVEVNPLIFEDPSLIIEDPADGWLIKIESNQEPDVSSLRGAKRKTKFSALKDDEDSDEEKEEDEDLFKDLEDLEDLEEEAEEEEEE